MLFTRLTSSRFLSILAIIQPNNTHIFSCWIGCHLDGLNLNHQYDQNCHIACYWHFHSQINQTQSKKPTTIWFPQILSLLLNVFIRFVVHYWIENNFYLIMESFFPTILNPALVICYFPINFLWFLFTLCLISLCNLILLSSLTNKQAICRFW